MLLTLLLICFCGFALAFLLRVAIFYVLRKKVGAKFCDSFELKGGWDFCSVESLRAKSARFSILADNLNVSFNLLAFFRSQRAMVIQITLDRFELEIFKVEKKTPKAKSEMSLEKWIRGQLISFIVIMFLKSMCVLLRSVKITVNGVTLSFDAVFLRFLRTSGKNVNLDLRVCDFISSHGEFGICQVPNLHLTIDSGEYFLRYLVSLFFPKMMFRTRMVSIEYDSKSLKLAALEGAIEIEGDDVACNLLLEPIEVRVPTMDLNTKSAVAVINDFVGNLHGFACGQMRVSRNDCCVLDIGSAVFERKILTLEDPKVVLSSVLLIDLGLLKRFFSGPYDPMKPRRPGRMQNVIIHSPTMDFTLALSDEHKYQFIGEKFAFQNMTALSEFVSCSAVFSTGVYHLFNATKALLLLEKPYLSVKADSIDGFLHPSFAQQSFLLETIQLLSFTNKQSTGVSTVSKDLLPPTKRIISLEFEHVSVKMLNVPAVSSIYKSVECKRAAIQALLLRQAMAIKQISEMPELHFNAQKFQEASVPLLFKLFRQAMSEAQSCDDHLFRLEADGFFLRINGPAFKNKAEAMEKVHEILPSVNSDDVYRPSGGELTFRARSLRGYVPKLGNILEMECPNNITGFLVTTKKIPRMRADIYHYRVRCDDGKVELVLPQVLSKSVIFLKLVGEIQRLKLKYTPVLSQVRQDFSFAKRTFSDKKIHCGYLKFVDMLRLRMKFHLNLSIRELEFRFNDRISPFRRQDLLLTKISDVNFTVIDQVIRAGTKSVSVMVSQDGSYQVLSTINQSTLEAQFSSFNDQNVDGVEPPLWIPIDAFRVHDVDYDPYEKFRTTEYRCSAVLTLGTQDKPIWINFDSVNPIIDHFLSYNEPTKKFSAVPRFGVYKYGLEFAGLSLDVSIAPINLTAKNGSLQAKLSGHEGNLRAHIATDSKQGSSSSLSDSELSFSLFCNNSQLFGARCCDFKWTSIAQYREVKAEETYIDFYPSVLSGLSGMNIHRIRYRSGVINFPEIYTVEELLPLFSTRLALYEFPSVHIKIDMKGLNQKVESTITQVSIETKCNPDGARLQAVHIGRIRSQTLANRPLVEVDGMIIYHASGTEMSADFIDIGSISVSILPDEFDYMRFLLYEIKDNIATLSSTVTQSSNLVIARAHNQVLNITSVALHLLHAPGPEQDRPLLSLYAQDITGKMYKQPEKGTSITGHLRALSIVNDPETDVFRDIFQTPERKEPLLALSVNKIEKTGKIPVFAKMELRILPFIIRIPMRLKNELRVFFPSSSDKFRLQDIVDDSDETESTDEHTPMQEEDDPFGPSSAAPDAIFVREFVIHPFSAAVSIRRDKQGKMLRDFVNRPFGYKGMRLYDVHGTKGQLFSFVKDQFKMAAWSEGPKMLLFKIRNPQLPTVKPPEDT